MSMLDDVTLAEIYGVKVIHQNVGESSVQYDLPVQRNILDPNDVILKRRQGEGRTPIFEREEIMEAAGESSEEKYRRIVYRVSSPSTSRRHTSKIRSLSYSSRRNRSHSTRYHTDSRHDGRIERHQRSSSLSMDERFYRNTSRNRSKESSYDKRNTSESYNCSTSEKRSRRSSRLPMVERSHHGRYRNRSMERSYERKDTYKSREQRNIPSRYMEPIPMPFYHIHHHIQVPWSQLQDIYKTL